MSRLDTRLRLTQKQQEREMIEFGEHECFVSMVTVILIACVLSGLLFYLRVIPTQNDTIARIKALDTQCEGVHR